MVKLNKVYDAKTSAWTYSKVVKDASGKEVTSSIKVFDYNKNEMIDNQDGLVLEKKTADGKDSESADAGFNEEEYVQFLADYKGVSKDKAMKDGKEVALADVKVVDKGSGAYELHMQDNIEYRLGSFVKAAAGSEDPAAEAESQETGSKYYQSDSRQTSSDDSSTNISLNTFLPHASGEPRSFRGFSTDISFEGCMPAVSGDLESMQTDLNGMNMLRNMYGNMTMNYGGQSYQSNSPAAALYGRVHAKLDQALKNIKSDEAKANAAKELEAKNTQTPAGEAANTGETTTTGEGAKAGEAGTIGVAASSTVVGTPADSKVAEQQTTEKLTAAEKAKQEEVSNICAELFVAMKGIGTDDAKLSGQLAKIKKENVVEVLALWNEKYSSQMDNETLIQSINNDVYDGEKELILPIKDKLVARLKEMGKTEDAVAYGAVITAEANSFVYTTDSVIEDAFAAMLASALESKTEAKLSYLTASEIEKEKNAAGTTTEKAPEVKEEKKEEAGNPAESKTGENKGASASVGFLGVKNSKDVTDMKNELAELKKAEAKLIPSDRSAAVQKAQMKEKIKSLEKKLANAQ